MGGSSKSEKFSSKLDFPTQVTESQNIKSVFIF